MLLLMFNSVLILLIGAPRQTDRLKHACEIGDEFREKYQRFRKFSALRKYGSEKIRWTRLQLHRTLASRGFSLFFIFQQVSCTVLEVFSGFRQYQFFYKLSLSLAFCMLRILFSFSSVSYSFSSSLLFFPSAGSVLNVLYPASDLARRDVLPADLLTIVVVEHFQSIVFLDTAIVQFKLCIYFSLNVPFLLRASLYFLPIFSLSFQASTKYCTLMSTLALVSSLCRDSLSSSSIDSADNISYRLSLSTQQYLPQHDTSFNEYSCYGLNSMKLFYISRKGVRLQHRWKIPSCSRQMPGSVLSWQYLPDTCCSCRALAILRTQDWVSLSWLTGMHFQTIFTFSLSSRMLLMRRSSNSALITSKVVALTNCICSCSPSATLKYSPFLVVAPRSSSSPYTTTTTTSPVNAQTMVSSLYLASECSPSSSYSHPDKYPCSWARKWSQYLVLVTQEQMRSS